MKQDELGYPILCDLGSAVFDEVRYPGVVQALPYRAPEVILGAPWNHKIDIWNFGVLVSQIAIVKGGRTQCTDEIQIWELLFAEHLFGKTDERGCLESMIRYIGAPSKECLERCERSDAFFDEKGKYC